MAREVNLQLAKGVRKWEQCLKHGYKYHYNERGVQHNSPEPPALPMPLHAPRFA